MFKTFVQQGRSPFDARSVLIVREHGKMARTPLAAFFNIPSMSMVVVNVVWLLWMCPLMGASVVFAEPGIEKGVTSDPLTVTKRVKPSEAFHFAYQDYLKGHYDLALSEFQQVVDDFPKSSLAAEAYYYIGECYDQQGNLKEAARALTTLIEQYGTSRQVPAALFKLGKVMVKAGHPHKAKAYWSRLIQDFRGSPEAKLATHRLKRLP